MVDYIREYGLDPEEVRKWGKKHYPQFASNLNLIAQLYLKKVRGITPRPPIETAQEVKVRDLKDGMRGLINVLIGIKVSERTYQGCPECRGRVVDGQCARCGKMIPDPKEFKWIVYSAGDDTGDVLFVLPPGVSETVTQDLEGCTVKAVGRYRNGEFIVSNFEIVQMAIDGNSNESVQNPEGAETENEFTDSENESSGESGDDIIAVGDLVETPNQSNKAELPDGLTEEQITHDVDLFLKVIKIFKRISVEEFNRWREAAKIKTPTDILLQRAGAKIDGDFVVLEGE